MSKLNFKEVGYYSGDGEPEAEADYSEDVTFDPVTHTTGGQDSYSLFGVEPIHGASSKKKKRKKIEKEKEADMEIESIYSVKTSSSDEVEKMDESISSAKKKRKKRKHSTSTTDQVESHDPVVKGFSHSSFIAKFLSKKREAAEVPEPPEIELANDDYLKQFQESCKAHKLIPDAAVDVSDSDDESTSSESKKEGVKLGGMSRIDSGGSAFGGSTDGDNDLPPKAKPDGPTTFALQFFNLPYRITVEQLQAFGKRHGYKFPTVTMGVDWKTKLPSGSATVQVELAPAPAGATAKHAVDLTEDDDPNLYGDPVNDEVTECIAALQGEDINGRPLRVQRFIVKKRQSGSLGGRGDSRYFSGDISCKCHSCGQVGHRQQDCTNEAVANPCHLCAGNDHDAGNCPNITCYRCGKFGHHSRDCTNASMAKPVICTHCGSTTHDSRNCRDIRSISSANKDVVASESKVAGPLVRCMSCNMFGHVMCQSLPPVPAASAGEIYCPNCGQSGHHIDFPLLCSVSLNKAGEPVRKKSRQQLQNESSVCMEPKFDAFIKYPQLLREIDSVPANERLGFFRDVTRRSSYADQMLFPPLARQLAPFNNNPSSSQAQKGNSAPQGRHSLGGGGGGGDNGRTVTTMQQRSQSVGPRVQQHGRSGFDSSNHGTNHNNSSSSALGKRKSNEPELASRYANLYPSNGYDEGHSHASNSGRDKERADRDRDFNHYNDSHGHNNRRNSFPANGAARGRMSSGGGGNESRGNVANAHNRFNSPDAKHPPQSSNNSSSSGHKSRPLPPSSAPPPPLPLPPMATASASWNARIESRKRRFQE